MIFQQILHNSLQALGIQRRDLLLSFHNVLFKTCLAITWLVNPTAVDGWQTPSALRTCEMLCNAFVLLGNSRDELKSVCHFWFDHSMLMVHKAKDILIEALTFSKPDAILLALDRLQKDSKVHFVVKLEDGGCFKVSKTMGLNASNSDYQSKTVSFPCCKLKSPSCIISACCSAPVILLQQRTTSLQQKPYSIS